MTRGMSTPTVLVVQHTAQGGPRRLGTWLEDAGIRLETVYAAEQPLPERLDRAGIAGLVVLGGGFLPDEDDRAPWLARTRALTEQALAAGVPYLGVCLGGQLLAHVAGGTVEAKVTSENGSVPVALRPETSGDRLFDGLPATVPAIEHHVDAITALPPGAAWLASSEHCPVQALRVGETAWGLQFHPEITAADIRATWDDADKETYASGAAADEPVSTPVWRELATRFARVVTERSRATAETSLLAREKSLPSDE